jgi:hypothetical protein
MAFLVIAKKINQKGGSEQFAERNLYIFCSPARKRKYFLLQEDNIIERKINLMKPPPLVRRCNGTTARLGYWKVGLEWPYNTPPGQ